VKVYVAGPMAGYPAFNYPAFHDAAARLRAAGYEVVSPAEVPLPCGCSGVPPQCGADDHDWSEFLRAALIAMLREADSVALLPGWQVSRGATIEYQLATGLGMKILPLDEWLEAAA
jgi:hypothetical protein